MSPWILDETGRPCPMPVIALGRAIRSRPAGTEVLLLADDPVVLTDVPAWCGMVGAELVSCVPAGGGFELLIRLP